MIMIDFSRLISWRTMALIFVLNGALAGGAHAGTSPFAETVVLNGKVITADSDDPKAVSFKEAIAIQGDRIMAVGSNAEIKRLVADWTEVIDAKGNSVYAVLRRCCRPDPSFR